MGPIRVLLVDDQTLFRRAIVSMLAFQNDIEVVGEASDGFEAIEMALKTEPEVILMDLNMPNCTGLEALVTIKEMMPDIKVIILTISDDDDDVFTAIKSGAEGYLLKNMEPYQLFDMIASVRRGLLAIEGPVAAKILQEFKQPTSMKEKPARENEALTPREVKVLELIVRGATNQEIAAKLYISENTVKLHLRNILTKLHLRNRIQVAVYAVSHGLVADYE
ncbi:MAG: response regulator transcription factor [Coriobacteriia bacterium]|nr:response regulator transcription factor [Coriobacteriia bacterium]